MANTEISADFYFFKQLPDSLCCANLPTWELFTCRNNFKQTKTGKNSIRERCITMLPSGNLNKRVSWPHSCIEKPKVWGRGSKKRLRSPKTSPTLVLLLLDSSMNIDSSALYLFLLHLCSFKCSHAAITCNSKASSVYYGWWHHFLCTSRVQKKIHRPQWFKWQ